MRCGVALALGISVMSLQAQELPPGSGRDAVTARCVTCHETDLIAGQRLSRADWGREIDKMVRWGAVVDQDEREPMLDYLAAQFTPKPMPAHLVATAGTEGVYKRACLVCHDDDLIEAQRLTSAGWTREVEKMMRWGAAVTDLEKDALVDYLSARYPPR